MKKCPNNHDNPDNAKFCRLCGYRFYKSFSGSFKNCCKSFCKKGLLLFNKDNFSGFTPDSFPHIKLKPRSVEKIDFNFRNGLVFIGLMILLLFAFEYFNENINIFLSNLLMSSTIPYYIFLSIKGVVGVTVLFLILRLLRRLWKWLIFNMNADYIETTPFNQKIYRIARRGKLGLFDRTKNSVILKSRYDNLTMFDSEHIVLERNRKYGLFSVKKNAIIVPIRFNKINGFKNAIVKCYKGAEIYYYDVNGNRMK